jgi:thiamine biosynthesis lipoprotein
MRIALAVAALALAGCALRPATRETAPSVETLISGETMGSAWTVKVAGELPMSAGELQAGIQARFEVVNQALSTWRADSALSRFNASPSPQWQDVDAELATVLAYALELGAASGGAYDVTVGPLVNLWGFGPDPATFRAPDPEAIARAKSRVGWHRVEVDVPRRRARKPPDVYVDLSSLGKGRGVDRVAEYLDALGVAHYLIDLSGKLRARGNNAAGVAWRVAVERPGADVDSGQISMDPAVVSLRDASIATAGDYRRYFESGGRHYSHIIDPHTGAPVSHATVSATAIADSCMEADAWATVFMAMAPREALALAAQRGVPALLIQRRGKAFIQDSSPAWTDSAPR